MSANTGDSWVLQCSRVDREMVEIESGLFFEESVDVSQRIRGVNEADVLGGTAGWGLCMRAPPELKSWVEVLWALWVVPDESHCLSKRH